MSQIKQQKEYLDELYYVTQKMTRDDYDDYQVFIKRQKDDEDFDKQSFERLEKLIAKYIKRKIK